MEATYPSPALTSAKEGSASIGALMDGIERLGLRFDLVDGRIRLLGERALLDEGQRAELVRRRGEVAALVRLALEPRQAGTPATPAAQLALSEAA
jgi:hypothetical protein